MTTLAAPTPTYPTPPPEKGMAFSDLMVRALLSGHKTQTRRIERRYRVGDIVHIRETWRARFDAAGRGYVELRADGLTRPWPAAIMNELPRVHAAHGEKWRPPMFMFKALARPERWRVVDERAERLQHISVEDAWAEGSWTRYPHSVVQDGEREFRWLSRDAPASVVDCFRLAWNAMYADDPDYRWEANPTVYAYTLEPVPPRSPEVTQRFYSGFRAEAPNALPPLRPNDAPGPVAPP